MSADAGQLPRQAADDLALRAGLIQHTPGAHPITTAGEPRTDAPPPATSRMSFSRSPPGPGTPALARARHRRGHPRHRHRLAVSAAGCPQPPPARLPPGSRSSPARPSPRRPNGPGRASEPTQPCAARSPRSTSSPARMPVRASSSMTRRSREVGPTGPGLSAERRPLPRQRIQRFQLDSGTQRCSICASSVRSALFSRGMPIRSIWLPASPGGQPCRCYGTGPVPKLQRFPSRSRALYPQWPWP
jgi:hypothetical protein